MEIEKLKIKDLVTIGVFTVIYFVLMFLSGMIGMVPILYLAYPAVAGIITGIVIMLFMAKVQKLWGLFILGLICSFIVIAMGNTYIILIHALISMVIAEFVRKIGGYKSFKYNMLSFTIFNTWICGFLMQILLAKDKVIEMAETKGMGYDYIMKLIALLNFRNMIFVYIGAIVGGIIGAYIGKVFLKKHFEKAGII
ncbi:MptD family putative ECF transporter S component [Parvimonas micra]|uniref:MptD family putative ECF transporter S component n=1 Tax=Parvimonas micra TaxID=33033 RepID=UPI0022B5EF35|nr:MptD family putative ECF transporter S component [Parvimonas micra]WBB32445.1 MptD family putative ECF transporter S component [Parvimonas micra]WBB33949.1 MptD family putative ECF transporter S component [Parvimonas micra]WBB35470.1 MptD family putative ECF transporter S component [Parvimonas micra]